MHRIIVADVNQGTQHAVLQTIERLQQLSLANPVMDVHMPYVYPSSSVVVELISQVSVQHSFDGARRPEVSRHPESMFFPHAFRRVTNRD